MEAYLEYERVGGPEGIDAYDEYCAEYWAGADEDGEIAYEAMLDRIASVETEIDAQHGV